ncbi:MAG: D-2-hydroxyacid dehydrogenase [Bacteroidaceae bacterium]|nr:D-2-hydroxyacid dehydrogenase [Bacteroidaceae bacterium]
MKVVILDGVTVTQSDLSWNSLTAKAADMGVSIELNVYPRTKPEETAGRIAGAEAVLTNKVVISDEIMAATPSLRYVGVLATGYNVVDVEAAARRGITVTNIPAYSTDSVAQLVFAHLLHVTNSIAHYAERRSLWPASPDFCWIDTPLTELAGKTFAIRGLGNIGTKVAGIAAAFGMNVIAVTSREPETLPHGVDSVTWEMALAEADVLSLHCPLTPATREIINAESLSRMRRSAILINTGRGPLVNEADVAAALHSGSLAAYCADVLSTEPPAADNPLLSAPRCYLTPHIAWASHEARIRLLAIATDNLLAFVNGHPKNKV